MEGLDFVKELVEVFNNRIKNPYDGFFTTKATSINNALTKFNYDDEQKDLINKVNKLENMLNSNQLDYKAIQDLAIDIRKQGNNVFKPYSKYPRVSRIFTCDGKIPIDKKGNPIFKNPMPEWYIPYRGIGIMESYIPACGGKRKTRKYKNRKHKSHMRKSHKRYN